MPGHRREPPRTSTSDLISSLWRSPSCSALYHPVDLLQEPRVGVGQLDLEMANRRGVLDLDHRPAPDDPAPVDDRHVIAEILDQIELMGGEQDGRPLGRALPKNLRHGLDPDRI